MDRYDESIVVAPGLHNIGYAPTALCFLDEHNLQILYRGYDIDELARRATYEECAYLLLFGELPTIAKYSAFRTVVAREREAVMAGFAKGGTFRAQLLLLDRNAHPMDMLRTLMSLLGANNLTAVPENDRIAHAVKLMAAMPVFVAAVGRYKRQDKRMRFPSRLQFDASSCAETFLTLMFGKIPSRQARAAFETSLILYLEHETNVGTHAVHTITSANADLHSADIGGVCALKGDAHGGANEAALDLLAQIGTEDRAVNVIRGILAVPDATVKGFGHAVYKHGDPRCRVLRDSGAFNDLVRTEKQRRLVALAEHVERVVFEESARLRSAHLYSNVDYWAAVLYAILGIPKELATPIFAMARNVGWSAHHLEYRAFARDHRNRLVLIRPRTLGYIGPGNRRMFPLSPVALSERNDGTEK